MHPHVSIDQAVGWLWTLLGALWLGTAFFRKPTVQRQSRGSRLLQAAIAFTGFWLLFDGGHRPAPGNPLIVPHEPAYQALGLVLLFAGLAFAGWARYILGDNWSGSVTLKQDHTLVQDGPYRLVRHPIYTGFLLGMLGTAIVYGRLYCFVGVAVAAIGFKLKSLTEEAFMRNQFGPRYDQYRDEVKGLVPYVW